MTRIRSAAAVGGLALAVVLIVTGIVYATAGPRVPTTDPLVLNGRSPRSVEFHVTVATGGLLTVSGDLWLDVTHSTLRAKLEVPLVSSSTEFDVLALDHEIYLTSPNLADATGPVWYTLHASWPSITRFAHYVVAPNVLLLTLLANARITHQGYTTTYESTRSHVSLGTFAAARVPPRSAGRLDVRLSTGAQGEFTGLWAALRSGAATTTVTLNVVGYDRPVLIVAPPRARATTPAGPLLRQLLTSGALGSVVAPTQLRQLLSRAKLS